MSRFLFLLLTTLCFTPLSAGCGEEEPIVKEGEHNIADELDPAQEAAAQKKAARENR
ncbi:hypothetical protein [Gimesia chilikensis]|uniref:hypothetical protein n=1 Tax=Gimesia chilikensis TaxID=2605989 RepID=UPI0011882B2E|nr:hypothetical protein [Gimesia chilikensis]QDT86795.1 hypothetical protein MalM14_44740 [Gimesia chilikensis]